MSKDEPQLEDGYIRIANNLFKAIRYAGFNGAEYDIMLFVIEQTYGYNKKGQYMTLKYIENGTGLSYSSVSKIVPKLISNGYLTEKYLSSQKREIGLNKKISGWKPLHNRETPCTNMTSQICNQPLHNRETNPCTNVKANIRQNNIRQNNTRQTFFEKNFDFSEMEAYAKAEGLKTDVEAFYLYNEGMGWKGVKDWKPMLKLWAKKNPLIDENSEEPVIGSIKPWKETDGTEWQ